MPEMNLSPGDAINLLLILRAVPFNGPAHTYTMDFSFHSLFFGEVKKEKVSS